MIDLDDKLVQDGLIDEDQLNLARLEGVKTDRSVWFVLVKMGYLSEDQVVSFFARHCGIPFVNPCDYRIKQVTLDLLEEHFCRQNCVLPLFRVKDVLYLACCNPLDSALLDAAGKMSGCSVEPLIATYSAIQQALDYYWKLDDRYFSAASFITAAVAMKGLTYWRQSERLPLALPLHIEVFDGALSLNGAKELKGESRDISADGRSMGVYAPLYLPKSLNIFICFESLGSVQAEIIHSQMIKNRRYFLGVRFLQPEQKYKEELLLLARKKQ